MRGGPAGRPAWPLRRALPGRTGWPRATWCLVACSGGADSLALAAALAFEAPRLGLRAGGDHRRPRRCSRGRPTRPAGSSRVLAELGLDPRALGPRDRRRPGRARAATRAPRRRPGRPGTRRSTRPRPPRGPRPSCSGTPWTTRPRPCCSGWPAAPGRARWPGWPRAAAGTCGRCSALRRAADPGGLRGPGPGAVGRPAQRRPRLRPGPGPRSRLLPALEAELGPGVAEALARTAGQLRADADVLDELAATAAAAARPTASWGCPPRPWPRCPRAIRGRVLQGRRAGRGRPGGRARPAPRHRDRRPGHRLARAARDRPARRHSVPAAVWQAAFRRLAGAALANTARDPAGPWDRRSRVDATDMGADLKEILITPEQLQQRIAELAAADRRGLR